MKNKKALLILLIVIGAILLFMTNLFIAHDGMNPLAVFEALNKKNEVIKNTIYEIRLPMLLTAILTGIALPVAGMQLQTLFNNPIAEPSILGASSMAGLGTSLLIFLNASIFANQFEINSWWKILFASFGSIIGLIIIARISHKTSRNASVLLAGVIIGTFAGALISSLQFFSSSDDYKKYLNWSLGSFDGLSWDQIYILLLVIIICLGVSILILKQLNVLLLGPKYAETMGVSVSNLRVIIILLSGVLSASITAFVGPIAFIGFIIPHVSRIIFKTTNHNWLFPINILLGILFVLFICLIRLVLPIGIPVNIITSLIGAPLTISLIIKQSKNM